ncbi:MAG: TMEM165/GDT1 family protein [Candidatus Hydrothermarchaeaceae archaeon]
MIDALPLFSTFAIIALAELGDKTQLLAMAFAIRYKLRDVLASVFAASALLMLLAVLVGRTLFILIPASYIQLTAGALFLLFAFWIFYSDEVEESASFDKTPVLAVFGAFILAEIGDKTQLAAIALTVKYNVLFEVWAGATAGMFAVNGIGIIAGSMMGAHLPQKLIKRIAAGLFFVFGAATLYGAL